MRLKGLATFLHRQVSLLRTPTYTPASSLSTGFGTGDNRNDNVTECADDYEQRLFGSLDNGPNMGNSFFRKLDKLEKAQGRSKSGSMMNGFGTGVNQNDNVTESTDDYEQRLFGSLDNGPNMGNSFFRTLDKLEKAQGRSKSGSMMNGRNFNIMDGLGDNFDTLSDGMDDKLKKAARTFEYSDEVFQDDYSYRADVVFKSGQTYERKDLDLTKPGFPKSFAKTEFKVTTKEVLKKADFRNVRFLQNFITESGIIIQRSKTKISAKAQRKIAREIKTARAFGLMPFTTMGTKPFKFGTNMEGDGYDYIDNSSDRPDPFGSAEPSEDI